MISPRLATSFFDIKNEETLDEIGCPLTFLLKLNY